METPGSSHGNIIPGRVVCNTTIKYIFYYKFSNRCYFHLNLVNNDIIGWIKITIKIKRNL